MQALIDLRKESGRRLRAFLVGVKREGQSDEQPQSLLAELGELVKNIGFKIAGSEIVFLREPNPHYMVGSGKFEQIRKRARNLNVDCIVIDDTLSPAQQRNWERDSGKCVIDRHEVILEIFASRAQTKEARLQVELARLEYSLPRLRRAWRHLSRQRGGGVKLRGAGESQLESDKRKINERIARLKVELAQIRKNRETGRKRRERSSLPNIAIVGYTNAGKSSLLNRLSKSDILAEDKLFATLDPTTREFELPSGASVLLTDTVGFVRKLPHGLVEAFKSTLEEAVVADMLIMLVDASNPDAMEHIDTAKGVLKELGAADKKLLLLLNKMDLAKDDALLHQLKLAYPDSMEVSVKTGAGLDRLIERLEALCLENSSLLDFILPHGEHSLLGILQSIGAVREKLYIDEGVFVRAYVPKRLEQSIARFGRLLSTSESKKLRNRFNLELVGLC